MSEMSKNTHICPATAEKNNAAVNVEVNIGQTNVRWKHHAVTTAKRIIQFGLMNAGRDRRYLTI